MASASLSSSAVSSNPALPFPCRSYPAPSPSSVRCRPIRVSAYCASTAERPRPMAAGAHPQSSLYEVLGVRAGATGQEIKTAYRRLARVLHPDVAASAGAAAAGHEFMRVHDAYATLSDPDRRADYDRTLFQVPGRFAASVPAASAHGPSRKWETDQCW
ncbi:chaperone protein dnaJ 11, chloroplastic-like [Rhodamnia argentea]|uniref:Chaperone protein dnaJ 11, chloroplastic-like n=1 Tax=Rhodamnia argentea TaxID=178133 RepID=A0A8B8Q4Y8_9MYRT|nr:chaperone protein dnaJ 11, chloroplastic-like [Rhodamnia argentea]